MSDLVLSRDEVRELCGTPVRKRQVAFLRKNGIRHYLDAHDRPVILRATVEGKASDGAGSAGWKSNKAA